MWRTTGQNFTNLNYILSQLSIELLINYPRDGLGNILNLMFGCSIVVKCGSLNVFSLQLVKFLYIISVNFIARYFTLLYGLPWFFAR